MEAERADRAVRDVRSSRSVPDGDRSDRTRVSAPEAGPGARSPLTLRDNETMTTVEAAAREARTYRASPAYDLVVFDRLEAAERALLGELTSDPSFYGVLRPADGETRSLRAVDRDTALLFLTLREPAPVPAYVRRTSGGDGDRAVQELVMDGVLEVWNGSEFVSGGRGAALILGTQDQGAGDGRLGTLSVSALRYGAALELEDRHALAARLYGYNRVPLSPQWAERLPDHHAVLRYVGGERKDAWGAFAPAQPAEAGGWIPFNRRDRDGQRRRNGRQTGHKLYISPLPHSLPEAFATMIAVLDHFPVLQFKLGGDAGGVLRPDKLVAYFTDAVALAEAGQALADRLAGLPAQGVPFSAELGGDGLLSWGVDPPPGERPLSWLPTESWRYWVVRRLAVALIEARRGGVDRGMPPERFALERLRMEGVDVERWVPSASMWREGER